MSPEFAFYLGFFMGCDPRRASDEAKWITIYPAGKGPRKSVGGGRGSRKSGGKKGSGKKDDGNKGGIPVLIDTESGIVIAGMGSGNNGKTFGQICKNKPGKSGAAGAAGEADEKGEGQHQQLKPAGNAGENDKDAVSLEKRRKIVDEIKENEERERQEAERKERDRRAEAELKAKLAAAAAEERAWETRRQARGLELQASQLITGKAVNRPPAFRRPDFDNVKTDEDRVKLYTVFLDTYNKLSAELHPQSSADEQRIMSQAASAAMRPFRFGRNTRTAEENERIRTTMKVDNNDLQRFFGQTSHTEIERQVQVDGEPDAVGLWREAQDFARFENSHSERKAYHHPDKNVIFMLQGKGGTPDKRDERYPKWYAHNSTVFHEYGHFIDHQAGDISQNYENGAFRAKITEEMNRLRKQAKKKAKEMAAEDVQFALWLKGKKADRDHALRLAYEKILPVAPCSRHMLEHISDMSSALFNERLGSWHPKRYWKQADYLMPKEAFAEMFQLRVSDKKGFAALQKAMPGSTQLFLEMLKII